MHVPSVPSSFSLPTCRNILHATIDTHSATVSRSSQTTCVHCDRCLTAHRCKLNGVKYSSSGPAGRAAKRRRFE